MGVKRLLIVRHGNTFEPGEPLRRIGARTDLPLTQEGKRQARCLGRWIAASWGGVDAALCGPLRRAEETARLILDECRAPEPLKIASFLDEIDHGPDEGRVEQEVLARVGAKALADWQRSATVPAGWRVDPIEQVQSWKRAADDFSAGTTLLVTSNGVARFALLALLKQRPAAGLQLRTGALGEIVVAEEDAYLVRWNVRPGEDNKLH